MAGLGDSRKAIEARYGKEISSSIMQSGLVVTYIHGEYYITVIYNKEGFCQSEFILKKLVESLDESTFQRFLARRRYKNSYKTMNRFTAH